MLLLRWKKRKTCFTRLTQTTSAAFSNWNKSEAPGWKTAEARQERVRGHPRNVGVARHSELQCCNKWDFPPSLPSSHLFTFGSSDPLHQTSNTFSWTESRKNIHLIKASLCSITCSAQQNIWPLHRCSFYTNKLMLKKKCNLSSPSGGPWVLQSIRGKKSLFCVGPNFNVN